MPPQNECPDEQGIKTVLPFDGGEKLHELRTNALMNKGLRPRCHQSLARTVATQNECPDEQGIKTVKLEEMSKNNNKLRTNALMNKGLRPGTDANRLPGRSNDLRTNALMNKGLRLNK